MIFSLFLLISSTSVSMLDNGYYLDQPFTVNSVDYDIKLHLTPTKKITELFETHNIPFHSHPDALKFPLV